MTYLVGYTADERGQEAVNFAISLARQEIEPLEVRCVLPKNSPFQGSYPPASDSLIESQAKRWVTQAVAEIPKDVSATGTVVYAESEAEGLMQPPTPGMLVVGAAREGLLKRFTVGSTASALLHSAQTPMALVPAGYRRQELPERISCAIGSREGAADVLAGSIELARRYQVPLRIISLFALGDSALGGREQLSTESEAQAREAIHDLLVHQADEPSSVSIEVGHGKEIENAVERLDWLDGEFLCIGSSRLAGAQSLFLGRTAQRILRALPVPMVVFPRRESDG